MFGDVQMVEFSFKDGKSINASLDKVSLWGTILIDILECGYFEVQPHKAYVSQRKRR